MTDQQISDALKRAKYNEAVILNVDTGTSETDRREIVLIPMLDVDGGIIWKDACTLNSSSDADIGLATHMRTKKWVIPMLNDDHRNKLYNAAIRRGCDETIGKLLDGKHKQNNEDDKETFRMLDIGSGTGFLALLGAKHALELSKDKILSKDGNPIIVTIKSVEMASAMARLANKTVTNNCLQDNVQIIEGNSCDVAFSPFDSLSAKANICTSELLESGLIGEGIIPVMRDAWNRHLAEDAIVIPQRARVYAQVIESTWVTNYRGPSSTMEVCLSPTSDTGNVLLDGGVMVPMHAEALLGSISNENSDFNLGRGPTDKDEIEYAKPLSKAALVLEFDFTSRETIPPEEGRSIKKELIAIETGKAHGVLFWWELDLYGETISTEIGKHWQDHWQQCVFVFGADNECQQLKKDEPFILITNHDDSSISFNLDTNVANNDESSLSKRRKIVTDTPRHVSFERALQLNDKERTINLCAAVKTALEVKGKESSILDISDFSLCSLIAATKYDATKVTSIESSSGDVPMLSAMVAQLGNELPKENCNFQIINAHLDSLSLEHVVQGEAADIVMAEPYYEIMQGWNLPSALNYHNTIKSLKKRGIVKVDAISVPSYACVKCCAIEFHPCVTDAYRGLTMEDGSLYGIKHDDTAFYGEKFHTYDMIFPLWQYKWKRLSDDFTMAKITYEGDDESMKIIGDGEWSKVKFTKTGTCHAIAFWIDYGLRVQNEKDSEQNDSNFVTISTGNRFNQQSVRMLPSPIVIGKEQIESIMLSVKPLFKDAKEMEDYSLEIKTEKI